MQKDYLLEFGIRANRLTPEESGNLNEKDLFNYNKKFYIFSRLGSYTPNKNEEEILTSNIKELLIRAINNNEDTPTLELILRKGDGRLNISVKELNVFGTVLDTFETLGIKNIGDLMDYPISKLSEVKSIGPTRIKIIQKELERYGLKLKK